MKCSDIDTDTVLRFLAKRQGIWHTWGKGYGMPSVAEAMPEGTPDKLQIAKMRQLARAKLIDGCTCGCRGDFEITRAGLARIGVPFSGVVAED